MLGEEQEASILPQVSGQLEDEGRGSDCALMGGDGMLAAVERRTLDNLRQEGL